MPLVDALVPLGPLPPRPLGPVAPVNPIGPASPTTQKATVLYSLPATTIQLLTIRPTIIIII